MFLVAVAVAVIAVMFFWRIKWGLLLSSFAVVAALLVMMKYHLTLTREFDLYRADLSGHWLKGEHLYKANLEGANLTRVNLSEADLRDAELEQVPA